MVESVGVALARRKILSAKIQEQARKSSAKLSGFRDLLKGDDFAFKGGCKRGIASAMERQAISSARASCVIARTRLSEKLRNMFDNAQVRARPFGRNRRTEVNISNVIRTPRNIRKTESYVTGILPAQTILRPGTRTDATLRDRYITLVIPKLPFPRP